MHISWHWFLSENLPAYLLLDEFILPCVFHHTYNNLLYTLPLYITTNILVFYWHYGAKYCVLVVCFFFMLRGWKVKWRSPSSLRSASTNNDSLWRAPAVSHFSEGQPTAAIIQRRTNKTIHKFLSLQWYRAQSNAVPLA